MRPWLRHRHQARQCRPRNLSLLRPGRRQTEPLVSRGSIFIETAPMHDVWNAMTLGMAALATGMVLAVVLFGGGT